MRYILALFILLYPCLGLTKTWKIAVLYWSMKIEGQVAMRKGLEEEAAKINSTTKHKIELIPFVAGEGRSGILNQISQFNQAIAKSPDAIIIQPTDNSVLHEGLLNANAQKIPVIAYDQYIAGGNLNSYITSGNYKGGVDNAVYLDSLFPKDQKLRIAVFEYPTVSSTTERVEGFFDGLRDKKRRFEVVRRYESVDPQSGKSAAAQFLKDFPNKGSVDVIFTVNDGGGLSIVDALAAKNRTELKHVTFDGDPASIENIKKKRLTVINSAQFCAELGRQSLRNAVEILENKKVSEKVLIPTFPVTSENHNQFRGWMSTPIAATKAHSQRTHFTQKPGYTTGKSKGEVVIRIGTTPLCPYICEKTPGIWSGYLFDILGEVSKSSGIGLRLESISRSRLVKSLVDKKVDAIILPTYLVRYLDTIQIYNPKLGITFTGATTKANINLIDTTSLKDFRVVYSDFGVKIRKWHQDLNAKKLVRLTGSDAAERMLKMITEDRSDVALGDYNVLRMALLEKKDASLKLLPTSFSGFNFLALTGLPNNPHIESFSASLENWFTESRKNGHMKTILTKYNLEDWYLLSQEE